MGNLESSQQPSDTGLKEDILGGLKKLQTDERVAGAPGDLMTHTASVSEVWAWVSVARSRSVPQALGVSQLTLAFSPGRPSPSLPLSVPQLTSPAPPSS